MFFGFNLNTITHVATQLFKFIEETELNAQQLTKNKGYGEFMVVNCTGH